MSTADDAGVLEFGFDEDVQQDGKTEAQSQSPYRRKRSTRNPSAMVSREELDKIIGDGTETTKQLLDLAVYTMLAQHEELDAKGKSPRGGKRGVGYQRLGYARVSIQQLADELRAKKSTVADSLTRLASKGLIKPLVTEGRTIPVVLLLHGLASGYPDADSAACVRLHGQSPGQSPRHRRFPKTPSENEEGLSPEGSPPSVVVPLRPKSPPSSGGRRLAAAAKSPADGASRRAAAAKAALDRSTWDSVLGEGNYSWTEQKNNVVVESTLLYRDEEGSDRGLMIRWTIDRFTSTAVVSFPRSKGYSEVSYPWAHVLETSKATWEEFAGEGHEYTTFDFLIVLERLGYVFAKRHTTIDSPVGFLDLVRQDVIAKHRWGECAFTNYRCRVPKEQSK